MSVFHEVGLAALLELRGRVLTPGHPGRPEVWWYDNESARHYGLFVDDQLAGCVSVTPQASPAEVSAGAVSGPAFHLHSMAVEFGWQGRGLGREMLTRVTETVAALGGGVVWATARPSAVGFYERCGFEAGDELRVPPTNARMRYVWLVLA